MFRVLSRASSAAALMAMLLGSAGCGNKKVPVYPTKGKLLIEGKPVANLNLSLIPEKPEVGAVASGGGTDEEGTFRVTTRMADQSQPEGAPAGEYVVVVSFDQLVEPFHMARSKTTKESLATRYNERYAQYTRPKTSKLRATVKPVGAGAVNEIGPYNLE